MPRRYPGLSGLAARGGDANQSFDYMGSVYGGGLLPGGRLRASPSNTGQPRSIYGVDFPVVGYPDTGWDPNQRLDQYQGSIPGVGMPLRGEIGGGPSGGAQTYSSSLTPFDPLDYSVNPPPDEDVSPTLVDTFLSNYNPNVGIRRYPNLSNSPPVTPEGYISPISEWPRAGSVRGHTSYGYPDLSHLPAVTVNAPYPVPGLGGLPSTYGGGQSWQSNAARGGGFSGSGYGSGRFAGPSVSFGYGGTMIGSTSGSIFGGNPSHGTILGY